MEELRRELKIYNSEHFTNRKVINKAEKDYTTMLGEVDNILKAKEELVLFYSDILTQGINKNRQEHINRLNKINGRFKIDVTMKELKEAKESVE